jgi:hypothetical protein
MKRLLSTVAAIALLSTSAVAGTTIEEPTMVYVKSGTLTHWQSQNAFKTAHVANIGGSKDSDASADGNLLVVFPGATDHELIIEAHRPDRQILERADVLLLDDQGNEVEHLRVEVSPFDEPATTVTLIGPSKGGRRSVTFFKCGKPFPCLDANLGRARNDDENSAPTININTSNVSSSAK